MPLKEEDGTIQILRKLGIPITRSNYLLLATAGVPIELDAEMAEELADLGVSYIVPEAKRLQ